VLLLLLAVIVVVVVVVFVVSRLSRSPARFQQAIYNFNSLVMTARMLRL
jgi:flagellar biogenesis protein FliO